jgi:hypothetical protein
MYNYTYSIIIFVYFNMNTINISNFDSLILIIHNIFHSFLISSNFPHNSVAFISVHFFFLILYFYLIPTISVLYRTLFFDLRMELSLQNQNSNITIRVLKFSLVCNFVKIVLNEHSALHFLLCTNVTRRSQTLHVASFKCSKL